MSGPVNLDEAEFTTASVPADAVLTLPIGGGYTGSLRGDGFCLVLVGEDLQTAYAALAVGRAGVGAWHVASDASSLRTFAAQALKAADLLDRGRGEN
jgi:hypothetical protein